jgi:oligopeptide/dipeptide ABC transporter ATP-binding protein
LRAVPRLDTPRAERLDGIAGTPPDPEPIRVGCPFVARCPERAERCAVEVPALRQVAPDHVAACHLVEPDAEAMRDE